jgi:hypothetical protein
VFPPAPYPHHFAHEYPRLFSASNPGLTGQQIITASMVCTDQAERKGI